MDKFVRMYVEVQGEKRPAIKSHHYTKDGSRTTPLEIKRFLFLIFASRVLLCSQGLSQTHGLLNLLGL